MKRKTNPKFSIPFHAFWWSNIPEIKGSAEHIYRNIPQNLKDKFKTKRLKNHIKAILTNLHVAQERNPDLCVMISLDRNKYYAFKRYDAMYLDYRYVKFLIDYLTGKGYLEFFKGVHFKNYSKASRIKATKKPLTLFAKYRKEGGKTIRRSIPVILRNDQKRDIDFDPNQDGIRQIILNVNRINKCLCRHEITVEAYGKYEKKILDEALNKYQGCQKYTRVFNNSSFEYGGRFYRHWSQGIPSNFRHNILIDGEKTVELDYSCLHIFMLYCMEGVQPPDGDLYNLQGIDPVFRSLIKIAVNISLNAESEQKAKQAIHNEINIQRKENPAVFYPTPTQIMEGLKSTHPVIAKYICTGMGIKLQKMDSNIAEKILLWFAERDICCLSIHDSFIVGEQYKEKLQELMTTFFVEYFTYQPRISQKYFDFNQGIESDNEIEERINMAA